ncbi:MAG: hypothetical protein ACXW03_08740 [Methylobacter sp.]|jgi:hypothetical protein
MATSKQVFSDKFIGIALLSLAGPLIWVVHFAVVYGVQHVACVALLNNADFWVATSIIVMTVVALLALLALILKPDILQRLSRNRIQEERIIVFLSGVMRTLAFLSILGVLWSGISLFFLPACGSVT